MTDYSLLLYQLRLQQIAEMSLGLPVSVTDDNIIEINNLIQAYSFVGLSTFDQITIRNRLNLLLQQVTPNESYFEQFSQVFNTQV